MVITTTRITQMHDIVKTLQDGPESVEKILWSEGPWLGEELEKAWEIKYRATRPLQHVVTISVEAKALCVKVCCLALH